MKKLISFIIYSDKGFLKKPDINQGIYLTFNMLHKPALLGILGAIIGLEGYQKNGVLPEYYEKLSHLPVGIRPVNDEQGNFQKTIITYNNTTGFASEEKGGNLIISEQTLIKPAYKIYLLLDLSKEIETKLYDNILSQNAEYLPYLGKNDYSLWWRKYEVQEYKWEHIKNVDESIKLSSVFIKKEAIRNSVENNEESFDLFNFSASSPESKFIFFERLPISMNKELFQYDYADFGYTNSKLKSGANISNLYKINSSDCTEYVQLNGDVCDN